MVSIKNNSFNGFSTSAYTIDDLNSTGNLALFTKEKKETILTVKNSLDFYENTGAREQQQWANNNFEFQNAIDLTSFWGPPYYGLNFEDNKPEHWSYDINSVHCRLFGNQKLSSLEIPIFKSICLKI